MCHEIWLKKLLFIQPDVKIHELQPGEAYLASVTSYNKKGTSVPKQLLVETLRLPDPQLVEEKLKVKIIEFIHYFSLDKTKPLVLILILKSDFSYNKTQ